MSVLLVITLLFPYLTKREKEFIIQRSSYLDMPLENFEISYADLQKLFPDYNVYQNGNLILNANIIDPSKVCLLVSKEKDHTLRNQLLVYNPNP